MNSNFYEGFNLDFIKTFGSIERHHDDYVLTSDDIKALKALLAFKEIKQEKEKKNSKKEGKKNFEKKESLIKVEFHESAKFLKEIDGIKVDVNLANNAIEDLIKDIKSSSNRFINKEALSLIVFESDKSVIGEFISKHHKWIPKHKVEFNFRIELPFNESLSFSNYIITVVESDKQKHFSIDLHFILEGVGVKQIEAMNKRIFSAQGLIEFIDLQEINTSSNINTVLHQNDMFADEILKSINEQIDESNMSNNHVSVSNDGVDLASFRSYNLMVKNDFTTLTEEERMYIEDGEHNIVNIDSVLDTRSTIRYGAAALSFYQFFDKMLSTGIYQDATRIGALLKNRSFMRNVLYAVIQEIPYRVNRKVQGYLKSNMMLSRKDIHDSILRILNKIIVKSNAEHRTRFIGGVSSLIEVILVSRLSRLNLIDFTELDQKMLTKFEDYVIDDSNINQVRGILVANQIHDVILNILKSTDNLMKSYSNIEDNSDTRGIDFDVVINDTLTSLDEVSDFLLTNELKKKDIDMIFDILFVYKNRRLLLNADDYRTLTENCIDVYESFKNNFELIANNYNFHIAIRSKRKEDIDRLLSKGKDYVLIHKNKISSVLSEIVKSLTNPKSIVQLRMKDDFIRKFVLVNFRNDENKVYYSFLRRNISSLGTSRCFEVLSQGLVPTRDILNLDTGKDDSLFGIFMNKQNMPHEFSSIIDSLPAIFTDAIEKSFFSFVENLVPKYGDFRVFQATMLFSKDLHKLAYLLSDYVIEFYQDFCPDLLKLLSTKIRYKDVTLKQRVKSLPIFVKKVNKTEFEGKDAIRTTAGAFVIQTKTPELIISESQNIIGDKFVDINSSLMKNGKVYISKNLMNNGFHDMFTVWPSSGKINIRIESGIAKEFVPNFDVIFDFERLTDPCLSLSKVVSTKSLYTKILELYSTSIRIFQSSIACLHQSYLTLIDDESLVKEGRDYVGLNQLLSRNEYFNKSLTSTWIQTIGDVRSVYAKVANHNIHIEKGFLSNVICEDSSITKDVVFNLDVKADTELVVNDLKSKSRFVSLSLSSFSFTAFLVNNLNRLYEQNPLFKDLVDSSMTAIRSRRDTTSAIFAEEVSNVFMSGSTYSLSNLIKVKTINTIATFLMNIINSDVSLDSLLNAKIEGLTGVLDAMLNAKTNVWNILPNNRDLNDIRDIALLEVMLSGGRKDNQIYFIPSFFTIRSKDDTDDSLDLIFSHIGRENVVNVNYNDLIGAKGKK